MKITGKLVLDNIEEKREEWLTIRSKGIGSSEIAILTGSNAFKSPLELWREKTGVSVSDFKDNRNMKRGRALESLIVDEFVQVTHNIFEAHQPYSIYCHKDYEWALASPDAFLFDSTAPDGYEYGIAEIKSPSRDSRGNWLESPPQYYVDQLLWQLGAIGLPWGYLVAAIGAEDLIYYRIAADIARYENMLELAYNFMECVKTDTPPTQHFEVQDAVIGMIPDSWVLPINKYQDLAKEKTELNRRIATIDRVQKQMKEELMQLSNGASTLVTGDGRISISITDVSVPPRMSKGYSYQTLKIRDNPQSL